MDHKFKVGDIVRQKRTSPYNQRDSNSTPGSKYNLPDSNGVVVYVSNNSRDHYNGQAITIDYNGVISPPVNSNCFELVEQEKSKSWLKITPPQPEKRELVRAVLDRTLGINFKGGEAFLFIRGDSSDCFSHTMSKDKLRELGETLIEISKEMK